MNLFQNLQLIKDSNDRILYKEELTDNHKNQKRKNRYYESIVSKINIFGRTHTYDFEFDIKRDIRVIEELKNKIKEPQILCYSGLDTVDIYVKDDNNFICNDCINWIYKQNKEKFNEPNIRECLLKCSVEDKEWTTQRNKNLTGIYYRKISFLPEIQNIVCDQCDKYLLTLNKIYDDLMFKKQEQQKITNEQKDEWKVVNIFKNINPTDRERSRDGYIDAEYLSKSGETVRMVSRDVFDVGCYFYPKRLEGSDDIFNKTLWTNEEKQLEIWLSKFGKFHGIKL